MATNMVKPISIRGRRVISYSQSAFGNYLPIILDRTCEHRMQQDSTARHVVRQPDICVDEKSRYGINSNSRGSKCTLHFPTIDPGVCTAAARAFDPEQSQVFRERHRPDNRGEPVIWTGLGPTHTRIPSLPPSSPMANRHHYSPIVLHDAPSTGAAAREPRP